MGKGGTAAPKGAKGGKADKGGKNETTGLNILEVLYGLDLDYIT